MGIFVPKGIRPPGVFPGAPRVIYKTKRKNLTHGSRLQRIDQMETLTAFRRFSERFHRHRPRLSPEESGYLHGHGFMPDKGALYGLPRDDVDSYLSDFQVAIMPLANGLHAAAVANRLLFWNLYSRLMPMASLAGSFQSGRPVIRIPEDAGRVLLMRPMMTTDETPATWTQAPDKAGHDRILLDIPGGQECGSVTRMLVLCDPDTNMPTIVAAVALEGPPGSHDGTGATVCSRSIDPGTGLAGASLRFQRGKVAAPEQSDNRTQVEVSGWWAMVRDVTAGLAQLPMAAILQIDLIDWPDPETGAQGCLVVDVTDRIDAAAFQVHGPLMASPPCIRFIREFGV